MSLFTCFLPSKKVEKSVEPRSEWFPPSPQPLYPIEGLDLTEKHWLKAAVGYGQAGLRHLCRVTFPHYKTPVNQLINNPIQGIYEIKGDDEKSEIRVGIAGDWAAGTQESDLVQAAMMGLRTIPERLLENIPDEKDPDSAFNPHYTLHCGDVYWVGRRVDVDHCCFGIKNSDDKFLLAVKWPLGSKGSFAFPGNHELYSGGRGFYSYFMPKLGLTDSAQKASYWCLVSKHWRIIGLGHHYACFNELEYTYTQEELLSNTAINDVDLCVIFPVSVSCSDTGYDSWALIPRIDLTNGISNIVSLDNSKIGLTVPQISWLKVNYIGITA